MSFTTVSPHEEEARAERETYFLLVAGCLEEWRARGLLETHFHMDSVSSARYRNLRRAGLRPHNTRLVAEALEAQGQNPGLAGCVIEELGGEPCRPLRRR